MLREVIGTPGVQLVAKVDGALGLAHGALLHGLDLDRVGSDEASFGRAGDDLNVYVVLPGKEKSLPDGELAEPLLFLAGQLKDLTEHVDSTGRLFEQYLHAGIGDDGAAHTRAHKVLDVLSDRGDAQVVFTCPFG